MTAVEGHRQGTLAQQIVKRHQLPLVVGHGERRHALAGLGGGFAGIVRFQTPDHPIHGLLIARDQIAGRFTEGLEPFIQGRIHVAAIQEGLGKALECRSAHTLAPLPPARLPISAACEPI